MASRGVNKVLIIGNLGNDPESRATQTGSCVTNISVATSESWRDQQTGEQKEKTEWHRIVMFNRLAEVARDYLRKGSKVYIEGKLQTRKWQDQNGQDRYTTEIVANELQMLDSRPEGGSAHPNTPVQQGMPQAAPQGQQQAPAQPAAPAPQDDFNDSIPF